MVYRFLFYAQSRAGKVALAGTRLMRACRDGPRPEKAERGMYENR